jgi:hypothetical protein
MGIQRRAIRRATLAMAGAGATLMLVVAGPAWAFQALPAGGQVNNDPSAGINPAVSVNGEEPTNADVVGGALTAGKVAVPWAIFRQGETGLHDQIFARSFASGAWTTRGTGTVGGRSTASSTFSGSLNFDQAQDGETPAIDFAGAGRTVPWATWYENTSNVAPDTSFGADNIFASRFDNTGDATQGKWIFAGQDRGPNVANAVPVPSLNIHTNDGAENPSVAGGSAAPPAAPGPWVTWQEGPTAGSDQIFVSKPVAAVTNNNNCDNIKPLGITINGDIPSIGGFCWQQVGIERVPSGTPTDPTLNVDTTRAGVEPDIAFTGTNDAVPWVVWYEEGNSGVGGLHNNELLFAAKGVADAAADGGFHWVAVGSQLSATLDTTDTCAASATNEGQCSLNKDPSADAEDPRVAAGTMNPANPTVPWVAWDETVAGVTQVLVSRLVGTGAAAHFELVNNGAPISIGANPSARPDITFSGNTPYVSWREDTGGGIEKAFVGHFVNASNPTFVLDESDVPLTATAQANVREPISSSCTANPFNGDGATCQGGAVGTPFFLFTNGTSPMSLFADAYQPATPATGAASVVTGSSATVSGSVNPAGAPVSVSFQYGTTTAYGLTTAAQTLSPDNAADAFSAALTALPAGTAIHYRAVATTDFGTLLGADQTFATTTPPPSPKPTPTPTPTPKPTAGIASAGRATVSGATATVPVSCTGGTSCRVTLTLTVHETLQGRKIIAVTARHVTRKKHKQVVIGSATATVRAGKKAKLKVKLNQAGRSLLSARHRLTPTLTVTEKLNGKSKKISQHKVTFKAPRVRRQQQR